MEELELYALGALPEEEGAALKEHVAGCGECAMKLAEAHGVAALLGFAAKQERAAGTIKAELMARIHASREKEVAYTWPLQNVEDSEGMEKLMNVLAAPDTVTVKLAGTSEEPRASGVVKYNGRMGTMVYSAQLPTLPAGKSYEMWLLPAKGAPISGGILGPDGNAWGNLYTAAVPAGTEATDFMVTIESSGTASQPSGPKVLAGAN